MLKCPYVAAVLNGAFSSQVRCWVHQAILWVCDMVQYNHALLTEPTECDHVRISMSNIFMCVIAVVYKIVKHFQKLSFSHKTLESLEFMLVLKDLKLW